MDDDASDDLDDGVEVVDLREPAPPAQTEGARRPSGRRGRGVAVAIIGVAVAAAAVGILLDSGREEASEPAPPPEAVAEPTDPEATAPPVVGSAGGPIELDAATVADLGAGDPAGGLALVDRSGVRFLDIGSGTLSTSTPLGLSLSPVVVDGGGVVAVDSSGGTIVEILPDGTRREVAPVGGPSDLGPRTSVVAITAESIWVVDPRRGLTLVALDRRGGRVMQRLRFPATVELVGFHRGRPVTAIASGGSQAIVRHEADGSRTEIATGWVIAQSGRYLLYRPCRPDGACQELTLLDLDTDDRTRATVPPDVGAYGSMDRALSPDGRWLVGLQLGDRTGPVLAVHQVLPADDGMLAEPFAVTSADLGFGGRSLAIAWSPDGAILAAPGSTGVTLIDPATRSITELPIRLDGDLPSVGWIPAGAGR